MREINICLPVAAQREALLIVESKYGTEGQEHWKKMNIFNFRSDAYSTLQAPKMPLLKTQSLGSVKLQLLMQNGGC